MDEGEKFLTEIIEDLKSVDFTEQEAKNILRAISAETPKKLWMDCQKWLEWCLENKRNMLFIDLAAKGLIEICYDENRERMYRLCDELKWNKDETSIQHLSGKKYKTENR